MTFAKALYIFSLSFQVYIWYQKHIPSKIGTMCTIHNINYNNTYSTNTASTMLLLFVL